MTLDDQAILLLSSIGTSPTAWVSISELGRNNLTKKAFGLYSEGYLQTQIMSGETHYGLTAKASQELTSEFKTNPQRVPEETRLLFRPTAKKPNPANGSTRQTA